MRGRIPLDGIEGLGFVKPPRKQFQGISKIGYCTRQVLQRMLANGSACRIRTLYIEFHAKMDPLKDKVGAQHSNRKETVHQLVLKQMLHDACQPGVDVQIVE